MCCSLWALWLLVKKVLWKLRICLKIIFCTPYFFIFKIRTITHPCLWWEKQEDGHQWPTKPQTFQWPWYYRSNWGVLHLAASDLKDWMKLGGKHGLFKIQCGRVCLPKHGEVPSCVARFVKSNTNLPTMSFGEELAFLLVKADQKCLCCPASKGKSLWRVCMAHFWEGNVQE